MRLLYVSHSFPPPNRPLANVGGMQRVATELYDALAADGRLCVKPLVLRSSFRWTPVRIVPFWLRLCRQLLKLPDQHHVDVVLFSSMVTATLAFPLSRKLRSRDVRTAAIPVGRDVTLEVSAYQRMLPYVLRSLDLILPISRATADACLARGASTEQIRVIPCGVDVRRVLPSSNRRIVRRELLAATGTSPDSLREDALLLCSVGRHVKRKGFAWFVDHVLPFLPPHVHYWLAGDGPTAPDVAAAVRHHGLEGRVKRLGHVPDSILRLVYGGSDLFIMPNVQVPGDVEGFGVVMLEAGASGLPTIAADIDGIPDVIHEGENGHLVPSGRPEGFVRAILEYDSNRRRLLTAAERSTQFVAGTFAWPRIVDRLVAALDSTLPAPRPPRRELPVVQSSEEPIT